MKSISLFFYSEALNPLFMTRKFLLCGLSRLYNDVKPINQLEKMNKIVEYEKTKNHYVVVSDSALMKNPETREWEECVIYKSYKNLLSSGEYEEIPEEERKIFVREKKDFMSKFSLCLDL